MAMSSCPGLIHSEITGEPMCPKDSNTCPPEWQSWEDYCDDCRGIQERWMELSGDCGRDAVEANAYEGR